MQVVLIDRPDYRWVVLLDDAGDRHRYVRRASATPSRPHLRILSHGLVRFTEDRGVPVLDGGRMPGRIVVERQGDYYLFDEQ